MDYFSIKTLLILDANGVLVKASENLYMLIQGLLQKDPVARIDWLELCLHPFWEGELSHLADLIENLKSSQDFHLEDSLYNALAQTKARNPSIDLTENSIINDSPQTLENLNQESKSLVIPDEEKVTLLSLESEKNTSIAKGTYILSKHQEDLGELNTVLDNTETNEYSNEIDDKCNTLNDPEISYSKKRNTSDLNKSAISFRQSDVLVGTNLNVIDHLYHSSDLMVTPIAENSKLLKQPILKWDSSTLGFIGVNLETLRDSNKDYLKQHLNNIFDSFLKYSKSQEKVCIRYKLNLLAYLISIAKLSELSNLIIEESHHKYLLKELKISQNIEIKIRIGINVILFYQVMMILNY